MEHRGVAKLLAPIARRVRLAVGRAVVQLVDDSLKLQGLQISLLSDEVRDKVERFQEYGFTSRPKPGAEAIVVSVGGNRNHPVVIAVDDRRFRLKNLAEGEVALYTDEGDVIHFKRGRTIEITAGTKIKATAPEIEAVASTKVKAATPLVECTGNVQVTGNLTVGGTLAVTGASTLTGGATIGGIAFGTHKHGGVQNGAGITGNPQ